MLIRELRPRDDCVRMQLPHIYWIPKKNRMVELHYDLSTVRFRYETGGVFGCGVHLTREATEELHQYLEDLKSSGVAKAEELRLPGLYSLSQIFPEYRDSRLFPRTTIGGWLLIPERNAETVAGDLDRILSNPHNWVPQTEGWAKDNPHLASIIRSLESTREEWDRRNRRATDALIP